MLRRVLCGHGAVDVGRAVAVLLNRNRNRIQNAQDHDLVMKFMTCCTPSANEHPPKADTDV
eukprot:3900984-Prymnesium_polylepis.1